MQSATELWPLVSDVLLLGVAGASLVTDLAVGRIFNKVTYTGAIAGLVAGGVLGGLPGLVNSLTGMSVGFLILFLFFLLKGVGGGDVKLMAAVGAIKGYPFILYALFWGSLLGGLMAVAGLIWRGRLTAFLRSAGWMIYGMVRPGARRPEAEAPGRESLPYGAGLALGAVVVNYLGFLRI